jgi:hypothetical protein
VGDEDVASLAARAIALAERAAGTQEAIIVQQARNRRQIRLIAVSVAVDIVLSVTCVFLAVSQARVSHQIHVSQLTSCRIGDDFRAGQVRLWDHVIAVSKAPPGETAAAREARLAKLAAFRAYVRAEFRPVNCSRLYGKP